ncbi:MAG: hypothetical protein R3Y24_07170 [Eubacteriales bacterium]
MDFTNEQKHIDAPFQTQHHFSSTNSEQPEINRFTTSALSFGVMALVSAVFFTVYLPFVFGGLSIIFALLSKGSFPTMHKKAKNGIKLAIIAFVINIIVVGSSVYMVFTTPEYREQINIMSEEMYGQSFDETLDELLNGTYE